MERKARLLKLLKQKKLLIILLIVTLIVTIVILFTVRNRSANVAQTSGTGLNAELPKANLKEDKDVSKLSFYEQAEKDSAKLKEQMKNDPYYKQGAEQMEESGFKWYQPLSNQSYISKLQSYSDPNEVKVYNKLAQLNQQIIQNNKQQPSKNEYAEYRDQNTSTLNSRDIDKLDGMMQYMKQGGKAGDPEMQQLNATLDKILEVQHPERIKEQAKNNVGKNDKKTMHASVGDRKAVIALMEPESSMQWPLQHAANNDIVGFYNGNRIDTTETANAILAAVDETQTVVNGSVIKLRLLQDVIIQGQVIPEGRFIYGIAALSDERLNIEINSIKYRNSLYSVKMSVYDLDGLSGIYIPGAISRDVAKQSAIDAVQSVELMSLDRSLSAQAAGAGISAAKSLLTKKTKQVKVTVKAGYQVLLKDANEKQ